MIGSPTIMESSKLSVLFIIVAASLWGVIGVFSRLLNDAGLTSMQTTEVRCFITASIMAIVLLIKDKNLFKIDIKDIWMFIGTGLFSIVTFNILYFETAELVSLSMTAVLLYTAPCFVMVLSAIIFKEAVTRQKILALALAFLGCIFTAGLIGGGGEFSMKGFMFGLGSGATYSLYSIIGKFALRKYDPMTMTFYTFLVAAASLFFISDPLYIVDVAVSSPKALLGMLGLGIFITTIPYFLYTKGLKGLDAGKASVIAFIEPMVATMAGIVIYGEALTVFNALGIFLILMSVVLLNMNFEKKDQNASAGSE